MTLCRYELGLPHYVRSQSTENQQETGERAPICLDDSHNCAPAMFSMMLRHVIAAETDGHLFEPLYKTGN